MCEPGAGHIEDDLEVADGHLEKLRVSNIEPERLVDEEALERAETTDDEGAKKHTPSALKLPTPKADLLEEGSAHD